MKKISIEILCDEFYVADSLHELASNIECGDIMDDVESNGMQEVTGDHYTAEVKEVIVKPAKRKSVGKEMEVLVAYDDEDGSHHNIAAMSEADWTGCKEEQMKQFLLNHYSAWFDCCDDDDRKEYEEEIAEAASRLCRGISASCCGDELYFKTVTLI